MSESDQKFGPPWTTLKILNWTKEYFERHELPDARLDAELLLSHALGCERIMLYAHFDRPLKDEELARIRAMIRRRAEHEPLGHITGQAGFWSIELRTDARALVPRSDTEALVEQALERLPEGAPARLVDVGTGSGAIALALAHERPEVRVAATDISAQALELAAENAQALELTDRVELFEGDLLEALDGEWAEGPLDMIVSNPPYIAADEHELMGPGVREFEPEQALFAGEDGLDVIRALVPQAFARLAEGGWFLCEIGFRQGDRVRALFEEQGFEDVEIAQDLGGRDRVVIGQRPA